MIRDANGNIIETAPKVLTFTTDPRVLIPGGPEFQPSEADPTTGLYLYSKVAFNEPISPAAPVGSTLGIKPLGGASLRNLTVVDCTPPPRPGRVDRCAAGPVHQPGQPRIEKPTLVILVKGSATLNVTTITTAKVGTATPVTSGLFGSLSKPVDLNGDGRKDRLYFFRPAETGLTCASTSVKIGGSMAGRAGHGPGRTRLEPILCA